MLSLRQIFNTTGLLAHLHFTETLFVELLCQALEGEHLSVETQQPATS